MHGPLIAVQALPGEGGTAARHVAIHTADTTRDLLLVANYKAPAGEGVAVYEWRSQATESATWQFAGYVDAPGAGEMTHCHLSRTGMPSQCALGGTAALHPPRASVSITLASDGRR